MSTAAPAVPVSSDTFAGLRGLVLFAGAYTLAVTASEHLYGTLALPSPFWFPDAVLLCGLLLSGRRHWWVVLAAACVIRLSVWPPLGTPVWFVLASITNDCLKGCLAAWLLERALGRPMRLYTPRQLLIFFAVAGVIVPALSAFAAAPLRYAMGNAFWPSWSRWFLGDALSQTVVLPPLFYWCTLRDEAEHIRWRELLVLVAGLGLVLYYAFVTPPAGHGLSLGYAPLPFLMWAATRLRPFGTANAIALVAIVTMVSAVNGTGLFTGNAVSRVLVIQLFLLLIAVCFLLLSTLVSENEASEQRFHLVTDTVPALIWMSQEDGTPTFFNNVWVDFTGCTLASLRAHGWTETFHPDDRAHYQEVMAAAVCARADFTAEFRLRQHDGVYRWIASRGTVRRERGGAFAGHICSGIDITERKEAERLGEQLSHYLIATQEQERSRVARELHDDIGQSMALLGVELHRLQQILDDASPPAQRQLETIVEQSASIASGLHAISHQLHPSTLYVLGLCVSLKSLCQSFSQQRHLRVRMTHRDVPAVIANDVSLTLYRITQEALRNVARHSGASEATVELTGDMHRLELRIADAGHGFDLQKVRRQRGLGLVSMRERLRAIGGELTIHSAPQRGTEILVRVPMLVASPTVAPPEPEASTFGA